MIKFELITPERVAMQEEIYEVILPTQSGQIAVLPGHVPLVTILRPGVITLRRQKGESDDELEHVATSGGFVEVTSNSVKVMADTAERAEDLDELKIEEAREAAQRQVREAKDEAAYADALGRLEIELARLKVKNLKRRHGSRVRNAALDQDQ